MITIDELKVQLADYGKAVKDLEEALAIDASRKRVQELEHTMSRPGFYDDAELSKKVFDEVGDLKGKLKEEYALTGGSTSCVGSGSIYTLDKDGKLVSIKTDYDPAVLDDGERSTNTAQDGTDGSVSASN